MTLEDIQINYKTFIENTYCAYSVLGVIIDEINNLISECYKFENCKEYFIDNLELNLVYLEKIYQYMNYVIENTENVAIPDMKFPEAKLYNFDNYIQVPDKYEQDIYVDINSSNLSDFWRQE